MGAVVIGLCFYNGVKTVFYRVGIGTDRWHARQCCKQSIWTGVFLSGTVISQQAVQNNPPTQETRSMNMKSVCHTAIAGALLALLSACAGTDNAASPQVAEAGQVCTTEAQLGSSIAKRTCHAPMSQEDRDAVNRDITLRSQPKPIIKQ
jgi:hypothetical protein